MGRWPVRRRQSGSRSAARYSHLHICSRGGKDGELTAEGKIKVYTVNFRLVVIGLSFRMTMWPTHVACIVLFTSVVQTP